MQSDSPEVRAFLGRHPDIRARYVSLPTGARLGQDDECAAALEALDLPDLYGPDTPPANDDPPAAPEFFRDLENWLPGPDRARDRKYVRGMLGTAAQAESHSYYLLFLAVDTIERDVLGPRNYQALLDYARPRALTAKQVDTRAAQFARDILSGTQRFPRSRMELRDAIERLHDSNGKSRIDKLTRAQAAMRYTKGETMEQIGDSLGVSKQAVSKWPEVRAAVAIRRAERGLRASGMRTARDRAED